ncbi:MAG TPA: DUF885 family protein, partial [Xanthomonadales bacterium]|nr:DUF885 family protein [Xanthomonadales bacterium]
MESPLAADAVAGITDEELQAVVAKHWEHMMRWAPAWATTLGDHRYDDQLARRNAAAIAEGARERHALWSHLRSIDYTELDDADRITYFVLDARLESEVKLDACRLHEWAVDSGGSSLFGELSYLVESHTVKEPRDAENLVARMRQARLLIEDTIENLQTGLDAGRVAAAEKVRRAIEQLDGELAKPADAWAMSQPAWAAKPGYPIDALRDVVATQIVPAVAALRDFLRDRVLPRGRTGKEGLAGLPDGERCYRAAIL